MCVVIRGGELVNRKDVQELSFCVSWAEFEPLSVEVTAAAPGSAAVARLGD